MLEVDFDDLDLGSKRKPTEWVAVLPVSAQQPRQRATRSQLKAQKARQVHKQDDKPQGAVKRQGMPAMSHAARMQELAACTDVRQPRPISAEDVAAGCQLFPAEDDEGNTEYKLRLKEPHCSPVRFQQLVTQMKFRLAEGNGECFYFIGVEDDGYPRGLTQADMDISLATLRAMAEEVHAATTLLSKPAGTRKRHCAIVRVQKLCVDAVTYTDLRIAVAGSVDAGKSSLVGVLTHGIDGRPLLDNGSGSARMNVFQHKHEIETGRTSSLTHQMLGYDEEGKVLNYAGVSVLTDAEMSSSARRVLRFIDLGGHEKYLKTALYGMTCMSPDYAVVCVCPLTGLTRVSHEHMAVALALDVPVACVITKADIAPPDAVEQVLQDLRRVIWAAASAGLPQTASQRPCRDSPALMTEVAPLVSQEGQAVKLANSLGQQRLSHNRTGLASHGTRAQWHQRLSAGSSRLLIPIFAVSSVTGIGLPLLHAFLHALPAPLQTPTHPKPSTGAPSHADSDVTASLSIAGDTGVTHCKIGSSGSSNGVYTSDSDSSGDVAHGHDNTSVGNSRGAEKEQTHFQVDHTYEVKGVGCVVSGTVVSGQVGVGQTLQLGPHGLGGFTAVEVTCIQRSQVPVRHVGVGQHATVALHPCSTPQPSVSAPFLQQQQTGSVQATGMVSHEMPSLAFKAVNAQGFSAAELPFQQQHDRFVLDHRIHQRGSAVASTQPVGFTAVAGGGLAHATAAGARTSTELAQDQFAPIDIKGQGMPLLTHRQTADLTLDHQQQQQQQQQQQLGQGFEEIAGTLGQGNGAVAQIPGSAEASPSLFAGSEPPNARKGMVLLDVAMHTRTSWEFEAIIVLLNGHWPARGLLSGRWPPNPQTPDTVLSSSLPETPLGASDSEPEVSSSDGVMPPLPGQGVAESPGAAGEGSASWQMRSLERPSLERATKKKQRYIPVIHCGSVRQAAQVTAMEELRDAENSAQLTSHMVDNCDMTSAVAAAKALRGCPSSLRHTSSGAASVLQDQWGSDESPAVDSDFGTLARVVFRFQQRPEWLLQGSRLIVRDRTDGCIAGAGTICKLLPLS